MVKDWQSDNYHLYKLVPTLSHNLLALDVAALPQGKFWSPAYKVKF